MLQNLKQTILNSLFITFLISIFFSYNLVYFFISWVGLNISLYGVFLTSNAKNKEEATVKYFTTGVILTAIFLFTMSLYAVEFLTFDINTLNYLFLKNYSISENGNFNLNILQKFFYTIIIFLFLFKLGAYPFHFYLVDIYEILEPRKSMFYYTIPLKITILLTLINFLEYFWFVNLYISEILFFSGLGSIIISSVTLYKQNKLRNFWALSYLNTIGFVLIAVSIGIGSCFGEISFRTAYFYFISYLIIWYFISNYILVYYKKVNQRWDKITTKITGGIRTHSFWPKTKISEIQYIVDLKIISKETSYLKWDFSETDWVIKKILKNMRNLNSKIKLNEISKVSDMLYIGKMERNWCNKLISYYVYPKLKYFINNNGNYTILFLKIFFIIAIINFMGLPPSLGFYAKTLVYVEFMNSQQFISYFWIIIMSTVVVGYGYLKLLLIILYDDVEKNLKIGNDIWTLKNDLYFDTHTKTTNNPIKFFKKGKNWTSENVAMTERILLGRSGNFSIIELNPNISEFVLSPLSENDNFLLSTFNNKKPLNIFKFYFQDKQKYEWNYIYNNCKENKNDVTISNFIWNGTIPLRGNFIDSTNESIYFKLYDYGTQTVYENNEDPYELLNDGYLIQLIDNCETLSSEPAIDSNNLIANYYGNVDYIDDTKIFGIKKIIKKLLWFFEILLLSFVILWPLFDFTLLFI